VPDEKPVRLAVELPAALYRDLQLYTDAIARAKDGKAPDPARLVVRMAQQFMAEDRAFLKLRRQRGL
jgi:hypothetical protein